MTKKSLWQFNFLKLCFAELDFSEGKISFGEERIDR